MSFALSLSSATVERLHECWNAVAEYGAEAAGEAVTEALSHLSALVDAQNAYWLAAVRVAGADGDPLRGWRPRAIRHLHSAPEDDRVVREGRRMCDDGSADESMIGNPRHAGVTRAHLLRDIVSPAWYRSAFYQTAYADRGIGDAVFIITNVNRDAESYLGFQRKGDRPPFSAEDRDLLAHAVRGLTRLHREALLGEGLLIADKPLTPAERRVLTLLLTERSEKEIAATLKLSPRTTHHYVTSILAKFGVNSRPALMALWIGGR
jgi:DNA-binding CsgD family transcriptional regulator